MMNYIVALFLKSFIYIEWRNFEGRLRRESSSSRSHGGKHIDECSGYLENTQSDKLMSENNLIAFSRSQKKKNR